MWSLNRSGKKSRYYHFRQNKRNNSGFQRNICNLLKIEIATVREQNKQNKERKEAFAKLEQLRKKGIVTDEKAE